MKYKLLVENFRKFVSEAEEDDFLGGDDLDIDMPGQQTASAHQRVQQAYIAARRSLGREGTESMGIAKAMTMLADDPKAIEMLKMLVTGDESTGYKFIDATKPKDTSVPQPPGTYRR